MKKSIVILATVFLTSCGTGFDLKISPDGMNVKTPFYNVEMGGKGISMDGTGSHISINKSGIAMNVDGNEGINMKVDSDGINMHSSGAFLSLGTQGKGKGDESLIKIAMNDANSDSKKKSVEISDEDKHQFSDISEEVFDTKSCKEQFHQLLKVYGNDYDFCFKNTAPRIQCDKTHQKESKVHIVIIFDDSGSMGAKIGDERMIDIAKEELKNYISQIDNSVDGNVIVYGHKGNNQNSGKNESCTAIESFGDFSHKKDVIQKIENLEPTGWTPIDKALQFAEKQLSETSEPNDKKVILLISDGKETCGGDPVQTAKRIASMPNTYIDVIGFNVYSEIQSELQAIAENGGGKYSNVRSRADFQRVFNEMQSFTNEIKCATSQAGIDLKNASDTINQYYLCMTNLREEEVKIMTTATPACQSEIEDFMSARVEKIEKKLKAVLENGEQKLESFQDSIDNVLKKF